MAAQGAIIIGNHFPFFLIFINSLPSLIWVTDIIPRVRSIYGVYSSCRFCNYIPRYEVYRDYIGFAFSVIMFVCLFTLGY